MVVIPGADVVITDEQAATLIGNTEADAEAYARDKGWVLRVERRDSKRIAYATNYLERGVVMVSIDNGVVTEAVPKELIPGADVVITDEQAATLIGKTEADAEAYAHDNGWVWRTGSRDGEQFMLTQDYCECRVTVSIDNSVVTEAVVG